MLADRFLRPGLPAIIVFLVSGCNLLYYSAMEKIGREKRDILAKRVVAGKKAQERAKEQFQTTLEAFSSVTGFDGGDLEKVYNKLNREYERAENRANAVSERIDAIEDVAKRLFKEWDREIAEIQNQSLRSKSRVLLKDTQDHYQVLIGKMKRAESDMEPVLTAYRDQVLFLKHNLNAKAIDSLKDTVVELNDDVAALVKDLEASISEADSFIASLES